MPSAQPFMSKKSKPKPKKKAAAQTAKKAPAAKAKNVVAAVASDDDDSDAENYQRKKNKAKPETAEVPSQSRCSWPVHRAVPAPQPGSARTASLSCSVGSASGLRTLHRGALWIAGAYEARG